MQQPASASWRVYRCDTCDVIGRCRDDEPLLCWYCGGPAVHTNGVSIPDWAKARADEALDQAVA